MDIEDDYSYSENESIEDTEDIEDVTMVDILSPEDIAQYMVDCIEAVSTVLNTSATITRVLLNYFKWDKQKLMEYFYENDPETLFSKVCINNPFKENTKSDKINPNNKLLEHTNNEIKTCDICLLTLPRSMMTELTCEHEFCINCWDEYLTQKILEQGTCQTILCAAHGCNVLVDDTTVMKLVKSSAVRQIYQSLITNSFIECNKFLKWCTSPGCSNVIKVQYADAMTVTCKCSHKFCFKCGKNWHEPVTCDILYKWECLDLHSVNWIILNTKNCPRCYVPIEKISGCDDMCCSRCRTHFCWGCLRYENEYYEHSCRNNSIKNGIHDHINVKIYLSFYNNYYTQKTLLQSERKLYEEIKKNMKKLEQHNITFITDINYFKNAVDILLLCRQTLMHGYIFAFYLEESNQKLIFESNQKDLEKATKYLSEYLQKDMTSENFNTIKKVVQDKYHYCKKRREVLLKHINEGYDNNWWNFNEKI